MMKLPHVAFAVSALLAASSAQAATIVLTLSQNYDFGAGFNTASLSFTLPADFSNAILTIDQFNADDRAVAQLNGTIVSDTGIYGPGEGQMQLTFGGPNDPFTFTSGNLLPHASVTSGFVAGSNVLNFIVNDTYSGIFGNTLETAGPSSLLFTGTVTYDQGSAVPEPATWAMMLVGFGAAGYSLRSQRRKSSVTLA